MTSTLLLAIIPIRDEIMDVTKLKRTIVSFLKRTSSGMKLLRYYYLWKKDYDKTLQITKVLKSQNDIVIVCRRVKEYGFREAINCEAYCFFNEIKKHYDVRLISIEYDIDTIRQEDGIIFIPFKEFPKYLSLYPPKLIHVFDSKINDVFNYNFALEHFIVISTLTSNKPIDESTIGRYDLLRLLHEIDHGLLELIVHSENAQSELYYLGIKCERMLLPFITPSLQKNESKTMKCIGFASSPLQKSDLSRKGVLLLKAVAMKNSDIQFVVAWRNSSIHDDGLRELENVTMLYNLETMNDFYNSIDCLIIPFTERDNHAVPFSCIEALSCHIPVIITNVLDIAQTIELCGWGISCNPHVDDISDAIRSIRMKYNDFLNAFSRKDIFHVFNKEQYICNMKEVYDACYERVQSITLQKWKKALEAEGKELVITRESMKKYYNEDDVVKKYFQIRFGEDKHFKFHKEQVLAVETILNKYFQSAHRTDTCILDLATGTGRLVYSLSQIGDVVLIDSSLKMLKSLKNNHIKICADLFNLPLKHYFDCIALLRVLRHYQFNDRQQLYQILYENLKEGGIVLCDVPIRSIEIQMRNIQGWQKYNIYDCFWELPDFEKEINMFGFTLHEYIPVGYSLTSEYESEGLSHNPVEYICAIQKKQITIR